MFAGGGGLDVEIESEVEDATKSGVAGVAGR